MTLLYTNVRGIVKKKTMKFRKKLQMLQKNDQMVSWKAKK